MVKRFPKNQKIQRGYVPITNFFKVIKRGKKSMQEEEEKLAQSKKPSILSGNMKRIKKIKDVQIKK